MRIPKALIGLVAAVSLLVIPADAAINVTLNGVSYSIPEPGDTAWGQNLTDYLVATGSGLLQKAGGNFTLTADVDFGNSFGLKSTYYKTRSSTPATSGQFRLGNAETISWRNAGNSANLSLTVNSSNLLEFNGTTIQPAGNYITALTGEVTASGPGSAAATVSNAAVIAKLLTGYSAGAGTVSSSDSILTAIQKVDGNDQLKVQKAAYTAKGDILVGSAAATPTALAVGSNGQVLTADSTQATGTKWASPGTGTVTSVTFTGDGTVLSSTPSSAVTTSGTLQASLNTQTARTFLSGPLSGSAAAPTFKALTVPSIQKFTTTGTQTGWLFTISTSSTLAVGDTYTNNGNTYTVLGALSAQSGQVLFMSGTGATSGGTLTRATGSGTSSITFSSKVALATYTAPTNPAALYWRVRLVGAGGSGGSGGSGGASGGAGTSTFFGANIISGNGGAGGTGGGAGGAAGGAGGTASLGSASGVAFSGGSGGGGDTTVAAGAGGGGMGAASGFGGGGGGAAGNQSNTGGAGAANTGAGGGGGAAQAAASSAGGGGAGGFVDAIITSPAASYPYVIGTKGTAGSAGSNATAGGDGADGIIEVTEYYQ